MKRTNGRGKEKPKKKVDEEEESEFERWMPQCPARNVSSLGRPFVSKRKRETEREGLTLH
jgi:hypothetical protein